MMATADGGMIASFLLALIGVPFAALIGWAAFQNRAKYYVLSVRPYPDKSRSSRKLTDEELATVKKAVTLIEGSEGALKGKPMINRDDLYRVASALGARIDETWQSEVTGVHWVALTYSKETSSSSSSYLAGGYRGGVASTRGQRAEASKNGVSSIPGVVADSQKQYSEEKKTSTHTGDTWTRPSEGNSGGYWSRQSEGSGGFFARRPHTPFQQHSFQPKVEILRPPRVPVVRISSDAFKRMMLYVEYAPKEVGWLGTVKGLENGDFFIDGVYLLKQRVTAVETELSVDGQSELSHSFKQKYGFAKSIEMSNDLKFWGHSHVEMEVFPSGTDERTMVRIGNDGIEWYVRGIFNKLGKIKFDVYRYDRNYRYIDVPWVVVDSETGETVKTRESILASITGFSSSSSAPKPATSESAAKTEGDETAKTESETAAEQPEAKPEVPAIPRMYEVLPAILRPDAALRAEVRKEYDSRVDENGYRAPSTTSNSLWGENKGHSGADFIDDRWIGDSAPAGTTPDSVATENKTETRTGDKTDGTTASSLTPSGKAASDGLSKLLAWFKDLIGIGGLASAPSAEDRKKAEQLKKGGQSSPSKPTVPPVMQDTKKPTVTSVPTVTKPSETQDTQVPQDTQDQEEKKETKDDGTNH